jgi:hypothetical protein
VAQLAHRVRLDLADALARQPELVADLLERPRTPVVEAEPKPDHALLAPVEAVEDTIDLLPKELARRRVERRDRCLVLDQRPELAVTVLADRRLERDRRAAVALHLFHPLRRDRPARVLGQLRRDLRRRRIAAERHRELSRRA